jgi:hypothetical protein
MPEQLNWPTRRSSPEEQRLIDEFRAIGSSIEDLPYTPEFDELCRRMNYELNDESRNRLFRQLSFLRQIGTMSNPSLLGGRRRISREEVSKSSGEIEQKPKLAVSSLDDLLDAYNRLGLPLDLLPYSKSFDELCERVLKTKQLDDRLRRAVFDKLVYLKMIGRLPFIATFSGPLSVAAGMSGRVHVSSPANEPSST